MTQVHNCKNLTDTGKVATQFAANLKQFSGAIVLLRGDMGAGKTTFVSMVLGILAPKVKVTSPTFTLINQYADNIYHADLYRFSEEGSEVELSQIGLGEILAGENFVFVEWSERLGDGKLSLAKMMARQLGKAVFTVTLTPTTDEGRTIEVEVSI